MAKKLLVIAAEASGDAHGASLIRAVQKRSDGKVEIYGVGGDQIRSTGAKEFFDLAHFHVTGLTEVIPKIYPYKKAFDRIVSTVRTIKPDLIVFIDNPGFNLRLAKKTAALGFNNMYYIAPQIWAWGQKRIRTIQSAFKKVLVVFDFEKPLYEKAGVPVAFVGHPLRDHLSAFLAQSPSRSESANGSLNICLLPGSRRGEIKRLLKDFANACQIIQKKYPKSTFTIVVAPTLNTDFFEKILGPQGRLFRWVGSDKAYKTIQESRLAIACSGTVTLECALLGTPMVIVYRTSWITYWLAKLFIQIPSIGLPNILLKENRFPELIQHKAEAHFIAEEVFKMIEQPTYERGLHQALQNVSLHLGPQGSAEKAAQEILDFLDVKVPADTV